MAVMLILDYDPANLCSWNVENHKRHNVPDGYGALKTAIVNAVKSNKIAALQLGQDIDDRNGEYIEGSINIDTTIVEIESLKYFLKQRGYTHGFFFPEGGVSEEYLDFQNQYYAPKLAAAVNAWKAVTHDAKLLNGKTPKQAMQKWLRENAHRYGLTKEDGNPNETGIEEICKVANWNTGGGAAKTPTIPTLVNDNSPPSQKPQKLKIFGAPAPVYDFDEEEIPF